MHLHINVFYTQFLHVIFTHISKRLGLDLGHDSLVMPGFQISYSYFYTTQSNIFIYFYTQYSYTSQPFIFSTQHSTTLLFYFHTMLSQFRTL